jgi:tetratricopeptide (TPR) repeat protein
MSQWQQILQRALQLHQAGNVSEAQALYRQILGGDPRNAVALHLLGVIAAQGGRSDEAVRLITQAIAIKPQFPEALANLGNALRDQGKLDEAIASYRKAIAISPGHAGAHLNLGTALRDKGLLDEAIGCLQKSIALRPDISEAHNNLGNALRDKGQLDQAMASYRKAIELNPKNSDAYNNLGVVLTDVRRWDDAIASLATAMQLQPGRADAHSNLGNALRGKGLFDEALAQCRTAVDLGPDSAIFQSNLGDVLKDTGQLNQAIACWRKAIALNPQYADAHCKLGMALLQAGELADGWSEYEWRWKASDFKERRDFPWPRWNPSDPACRTVLLTIEQGQGDVIQFIRYAPLVAQRCQRVLLQCHRTLLLLLQGIGGVSELIRQGEPLPAFDAHCPLMSLPGLLGTTLESIPAHVPYIKPDPVRTAGWADKLSAERRWKIGLVWAGSPKHENDRNRSMALTDFAPLAGIPDVVFHSLQTGDAAGQSASPPAGMELIDHAADLRDFADTAALIANLDLVISVDTAVVHLAGAMAKPVWTLLAFNPDWRWLLNRTDTPWYPTMRLFRQPAIGDWPSVMRQVAQALGQQAVKHGG